MQNDLLQVQAFTESSWATAGTPTVKLMQVKQFKITGDSKVENPDTMLGQLGPGDQVVTLAHAGKFTFEQYGLYEDLCYWWENLFMQATPSGAGPYDRAYNAPLASAPTIRPYTLMHGASGASNAVRAVGSLVTDLEVKFSSRDYLMVSGSGVCKQVEQGQTLASLNSRAVNHILGRHLALYVDAIGGTVGSTAITLSAFEGSLKIKAPRSLLDYINSPTAGDYSWQKYSASLTLHVEWNATTSPWTSEILSTTTPHRRLIRIQGDDTANRQVRLDMAAASDGKIDFWKGKNGRCSVDVTYALFNDSTFGNYLKTSVKNGLSTLP